MQATTSRAPAWVPPPPPGRLGRLSRAGLAIGLGIFLAGAILAAASFVEPLASSPAFYRVVLLVSMVAAPAWFTVLLLSLLLALNLPRLDAMSAGLWTRLRPGIPAVSWYCGVLGLVLVGLFTLYSSAAVASDTWLVAAALAPGNLFSALNHARAETMFMMGQAALAVGYTLALWHRYGTLRQHPAP